MFGDIVHVKLKNAISTVGVTALADQGCLRMNARKREQAVATVMLPTAAIEQRPTPSAINQVMSLLQCKFSET